MGIRYILFGDRLCGCPVFVRSKVHTKLLIFGFMSKVYKLHIQLSFGTFGHYVQKSLFRFFQGIILLPADFPAVKRFIHLCIGSNFHVLQMLHIVLNVKGVFLVIIGQLPVSAMLRYIEFIREEWSDTSKLHDTFPAVHDRNLILAHQFFDTLSSEEFIPFAFSYTESCKCSINVLNYSKSEYKEKYICVFGK